MNYTESDLSKIQNAIIELGAGERVVQISYSNGTVVEYARAELGELKRLRAEIKAELRSAVQTPRYFRTVTSKGL